MKILFTCISFILLFTYVDGQPTQQNSKWKEQILNNPDLSKEEFKDSLLKYDLGSLWTKTGFNTGLGFIGKDYQRIRMKIFTAKKDNNNPCSYLIYGKSMVKNNVCQFTGEIKLISARTYKNMHWGVDDEYKNKGIKTQGILITQYHFSEDSSQFHSGVFEGELTTKWYIDKDGNILYDDIQKFSDPYSNNQFTGTWKQHNSSLTMTCNWGDQRIPNSGELDIGTVEFSPDPKYLKNGWQNYHDAWNNQSKAAREEEEREWWK